MHFTVLIPARLASTRLPDKPLADIAGKPMVVRVAERALLSGAARVVVACDDLRILQACSAHQVKAVLTRSNHLSGSDRLAEACDLLGLQGDDMVVNVQGDEPLIDPELVREVANVLAQREDCVMSTAAHPLTELADYLNPNVVKVVLDAAGRALYFSRASIPWWRDGASTGHTALPTPAPLRHLGIYAYRAGFLRQFPFCHPHRWSTLKHWSNCACCGMATALRCMWCPTGRGPAWTRPKIWRVSGLCLPPVCRQLDPPVSGRAT